MCNGVGHTHDLTIMTQHIVQVAHQVAHYLEKLNQNQSALFVSKPLEIQIVVPRLVVTSSAWNV